MSPTVLAGAAAVAARVGDELGRSGWVTIEQDRVDLFADATGDHQWIHVDVERAAAESPFGGPIAHGYLTLSLLPALLDEVVRVDGFAAAANDGVEKVRFPAPVPVGSRARLAVALAAADEVPGGVRATYDCTVEVEGAPKPACVARVVYRYTG